MRQTSRSHLDDIHDGYYVTSAKWESDLGFIGGAELDLFGNLNTTYVGGRENLQVRLREAEEE